MKSSIRLLSEWKERRQFPAGEWPGTDRLQQRTLRRVRSQPGTGHDAPGGAKGSGEGALVSAGKGRVET